MFPQRISSLAFRPADSHPDAAEALEQHVLEGFTPDLALDLVLNLLVMRAVDATHASAAALALLRGKEMVCRAATGPLTPGLGIPLNPREGLSGVCFHTRQPQICVDSELDPRVDPSISRRLGIRSILTVPIFAANDHDTMDRNAQFAGVLEVFSGSPAAFSDADRKLLEGFAEECARVRHAALRLNQRKPIAVSSTVRILPALVSSDLTPPDATLSDFTTAGPLPARRLPYHAWAIFLGALTIVAAIIVSVLIGSRTGWLDPSASHAQTSQRIPANTSAPAAGNLPTAAADNDRADPSSAKVSEKLLAGMPEKRLKKAPEKASQKSSTTPDSPESGDLVVYEKGKVIFRLKPGPATAKPDQAKPGSGSELVATSTTKIPATNSTTKGATTSSAASPGVSLSPGQAAELLQSRTEPEYPPQALTARRTGNVVLEIQVAEDGSVSNIRTLSGDPLLAAAATQAVRNWRYQPYRLNDRPSQFQTDVTLTFTLPN